MPPPLRALIFDLDGTLADTERDGHRVAFNLAFREAGLDWEWGVEEYGALLAVTGGRERIEHYARTARGLGSAEAKELAARLHPAKNRHFAALAARAAIPLRPGVQSLLDEARREGLRLAIATTAHPENVTAVLRATLGPDGERRFDVIGAGDVVRAKKPAPDVYLWVLERLGLAGRECLALEDSDLGLRAALGAGIPTIVSTNPYTRSGDFSGALLVTGDLSGMTLARLRELHRDHARPR